MGPENRRRETARVVRLQYASRAIGTTRGRKIRYGVICMTINIRGLSLLASRIVSPPYDDQENFVGLCLPRIPFSTDQRPFSTICCRIVQIRIVSKQSKSYR